MEFVSIPKGSFMMGTETTDWRDWSLKPVHRVTINYSIYMGKYEVTQVQWAAVMGSRPSWSSLPGFICDQCPMFQVSWNDAQEFIRKLNEMNDGYTYRLPSEAEWEYACRAGTTTAFAFGNSISSKQANFDGNYPYGGAAKGVYRHHLTPVGSFQPNAWGLYDMHGNVSEWCEDVWHGDYNGAPNDGSAWLTGGENYRRLTDGEDYRRVVRGGAWNSGGNILRSAVRERAGVMGDVGFRLVAVSRSS
jgi:formylglycine-generating enzyme required for sulfatase activity